MFCVGFLFVCLFVCFFFPLRSLLISMSCARFDHITDLKACRRQWGGNEVSEWNGRHLQREPRAVKSCKTGSHTPAHTLALVLGLSVWLAGSSLFLFGGAE